MEHWIRMYWEQRLLEARIFFRPELRKEKYDFMLRGEATADWPTFVAKEAQFNDYMAWAEKKVGAARPMSDVYRLLERFIYPYGKRAQTRRSHVKADLHVGEGRMMQGKTPRAFVKLPPHSVMSAHFNIVTGRGTLSERRAWELEVLNGMQSFDTVARGHQSGHTGPGVV